ncbi:MAG: hypothetical protein C7B44_11920 [Sulfobacillus thermosulfidooxidans]|uniref:Lipopolysaccharide assembly protein A domain-containing protein n=1 Tax=Sulfobacillus thermotolerans TaxID=338644 RepID=A0ABM6RPP6_9FIRM|nr:hypothetical protein [Sulfobacillus sp. hq2]AUW93414.1 hypothetical protein BXT84_05135 [Sulfobacillus thermotolerans]POB10645.1 hypothetical protein CO251_07375 [Sulfobacillus sp. hq2]PSR35883.1 MAG: hypothetical protein C7B44_11920 [Sulfobacillus thermosulfidooxidans]
MKSASWLTGLSILGGLWLILSPAIVGFPAPHSHHIWTASLALATIFGGLFVVLGVVGLTGFYASVVPKRLHMSRQPTPQTPLPEPSPLREKPRAVATPVQNQDDTDALLNELMRRLLHDGPA